MAKLVSWSLVVLGLAVATAVGAGCGDDAATTPLDSDAGSDASVPGLDASPRLDAGTDAATDAAPPDAGPPDLGLDAKVNAAVHLGTSWYLGGSFTHVHAAPAPHLLPIDLAGNPVATCKMGTGFDGYVGTSLVVGGSLYVGGNFASYNGVPARNIAKLDKTTCAIDKTFNPAGGGFDATVNSLAVLGTSLYVGGRFTAYRGVADSAARLAKLDLTTGALDPTFSPAGAAGNGFDDAVNALAVSGTSLYVAGQFTSYRGGASTPQRIAKLDATTGVNDATFCPDGMGFSGNAEAVIVAGASLYVGGSFTAYRGVAGSAAQLAKLDLATGALDTIFSPPGANGFNSSVSSLAASATSLYVGGSFSKYNVGNVAVSSLAKLGLTTGTLDTTFSPPASNGFVGYVNSVAVTGSSVWVGGAFTSYRGGKGNARNVAKLDATTGVLDSSGLLGVGVGDYLSSVQVAGSTVWVTGGFSAYGGEPVGGLVKVDDVTFDVDRTFSPVAQNGFDGQVIALASSGTSLFVGGAFTAYRGVADSAHDIAKLDAATGAIDTAFSPVGATTNGFAPAGASVVAIVIDGSAVYVGLGGSGLKYRNTAVPQGLVKLDTAGGLDATFNVGGGFNSVCTAVAVAGTSVYVGGFFSTYRGGSAVSLAKLDTTTGALDTTFSPPGPGANGVNGIVFALASSGTSLYLAGGFTAYRGVADSAFDIAKVDLTTGALDTTFSPPGAGLNGFTFASAASGGTEARALAVSGTSLFVGGIFDSYRGVAASSNALAKLDLTTGAPDTTFSPPGPGMNGFTSAYGSENIRGFAVSGSSLLFCGELTRYRDAPTPRRNAMAVNSTTGVLQ